MDICVEVCQHNGHVWRHVCVDMINTKISNSSLGRCSSHASFVIANHTPKNQTFTSLFTLHAAAPLSAGPVSAGPLSGQGQSRQVSQKLARKRAEQLSLGRVNWMGANGAAKAMATLDKWQHMQHDEKDDAAWLG